MPVYHLFQIRPDAEQLRALRTNEKPELAAAWLSGRLGQIAGALEQDLYRFTAIVKARDLEDLFYKTNAIDAPWTDGPAVLHVEPGAQSTSVGDVAVDLEADEASLCAVLGWEVLSWDRAQDFHVKASQLPIPEENAPAP
ncbi:hypothetical protein [Defluviimonas salinarum]|uniref:YCII-related domain-containing protein n=1 Tax=Defluviimonas salinarum TaxID=2992147 RepID=A0ABT3J492_9RHOB|nr:hypothetical protein [Defluviimonas salinarum]MCW3782490.1 hypothetical protein [Defluviimonas salinarum]